MAGLQIHPRTMIVQQAEHELEGELHRIWEKYGLTTLEAMMITQRMAPRLAKYLLRTERHGDNPDGKKADEA